jgi:hypothetical protein
MKEINFSTSACRYCRFYKPEGRRGGSCQQLGVPVESSWKACAFASSPFETTLKKLEDILYLETSISLQSATKLTPKTSEINVDHNYQSTAINKLE